MDDKGTREPSRRAAALISAVRFSAEPIADVAEALGLQPECLGCWLRLIERIGIREQRDGLGNSYNSVRKGQPVYASAR